MRQFIGVLGLVGIVVSAGCSDSSQSATDVDCDSVPVIRTTSDGVDFVRTPSRCFEGLAGFDYELKEEDPKIQPTSSTTTKMGREILCDFVRWRPPPAGADPPE